MKYGPLAALACAGCVAHVPRGHYDPVAHRMCAGKVCYRVGPLPSSWELVQSDGAQAGFYSRASGAVIASNATCHDEGDATPLESLTRHLLIGYTDHRVLAQKELMLDGRAALRTRVSAKLDGVPIELELYVLKRNGCTFDLSYAAPAGHDARGAADFAAFVRGFADERRFDREASR
jgi:hypothetical protein